MLHELKILPENFEDITAGRKDFEIRKNDRDYKQGDTWTVYWYLCGTDLETQYGAATLSRIPTNRLCHFTVDKL